MGIMYGVCNVKVRCKQKARGIVIEGNQCRVGGGTKVSLACLSVDVANRDIRQMGRGE